MSIVVGENSWVTIVEADEYLTYRLGTNSWFDLDDAPANPGDASKETFLRMAYDTIINKASYCGIASTTTDDNLKKAQIELAYYFSVDYANFLQQSNILSKGVESFKLSKWEERYGSNMNWAGDFPLPAQVENYLSGYYCANSTVNLTTSED